MLERRPPKIKASIFTPAGLSHSLSRAGLLVADTVKREFGCAALRPALPSSGVQSLPCQSIKCAGASPKPSHQTSPSSVSATLVKITSLFNDNMQFGLVCMLVPGATPK